MFAIQLSKTVIRILYITILLMLAVTLSLYSVTVEQVRNPVTFDGTWVSDSGQNLDEHSLNRINRLIAEVEAETTAEIAVVIMPTIGQQTPKEFATELFNYWGVGKKGKDNGLLLLIVIDQRRWEFETGYGLEGILPDSRLKILGETVLVPALRAGKMGEGIYNVVSHIANDVKNERPGELAESAAETLDSYSDLDVHLKRGLLYFCLSGIIFLILKFRHSKDTSPRPHKWFWFSFYSLWVPAAYLIYNIFSYPVPQISIYLFLTLFTGVWRLRQNAALNLAEEKDAYKRYLKLRESHGGWFWVLMFLFPLGLFPLGIAAALQLRKFRREPRFCPSCRISLTCLDEKADDYFLDKGRQLEEKLGSVDYDVWKCSSCDHVTIHAYDAFFTRYSSCNKCAYKTFHQVGSRTISSPTCYSSGTGERDFRCEHCSYTRTETYTIPARDCSSSSSSGSSSGGGGGSSFGGGSSGGGGAGGSW